MTPLFAPRPRPAGVGFGPDFGDRMRNLVPGWRPSDQGRSLETYAPPAPKPDPYAVYAPPTPKPDPYANPGWMGRPGWQGQNGVFPAAANWGQRAGDFSGFDPWTERLRRQGEFAWLGGGGWLR